MHHKILVNGIMVGNVKQNGFAKYQVQFGDENPSNHWTIDTAKQFIKDELAARMIKNSSMNIRTINLILSSLVFEEVQEPINISNTNDIADDIFEKWSSTAYNQMSMGQ